MISQLSRADVFSAGSKLFWGLLFQQRRLSCFKHPLKFMLAVLKGFSGSINSAPNKEFNILRGKEFSVFSPIIPLETDLLSSITAIWLFISASQFVVF